MPDRATARTSTSEVLAALATLPPTPGNAELAAALGWSPGEMAPVLDALVRAELVERWGSPGSVKIMLSAVALDRLGLRLDPSGERWNRPSPPRTATKIS